MTLIPCTYGYAIVNYRLIHLTRYINRTVAYMLSFVLLAGLYFIIDILLAQFLPLEIWKKSKGRSIGYNIPCFRG
jgi:hypothetical protein